MWLWLKPKTVSGSGGKSNKESKNPGKEFLLKSAIANRHSAILKAGA